MGRRKFPTPEGTLEGAGAEVSAREILGGAACPAKGDTRCKRGAAVRYQGCLASAMVSLLRLIVGSEDVHCVVLTQARESRLVGLGKEALHLHIGEIACLDVMA